MGHEIELNHKSQNQKNHEVKLPVKKVMRGKIKKQINKKDPKQKKKLKKMKTKIDIKKY
jgi:hypothetical protein